MQTLVPRLLDISDDPSTHSVRAAANDLILSLKPFPFQELAARFPLERNSYRRANLLWLMHLGATLDDDAPKLLAMARNELSNQAPGVRHHERRCADDGPQVPELRVCDVAFNVLVQRMKLVGWIGGQIHDNAIEQRNRLIARLQAALASPRSLTVARPAKSAPTPGVRTSRPAWKKHLTIFATCLAAAGCAAIFLAPHRSAAK